MTIYTKTPHYRKIWESHHGPIPREPDGRSYEIHHIDGNKNNNDITNLQCMTIQEHYDIHYSQSDYLACTLIALRMDMTPQELIKIASDAGRKSAIQRLKDGTHNFIGLNEKRVAEGTHNWLRGHPSRNKIDQIQRDLVTNGTHHLLGGKVQKQQLLDGKNKLVGGEIQRHTAKKLLSERKFHSFTVRTCPHCNTSCKGNGYFRYHGDRCKHR